MGSPFPDVEILRQNTSSAGQWLAQSGSKNPYREGPLGVIQIGAYADLLLVDGNPVEDVTVMADWQNNIKLIMKDGETWKNVTPGNLRGAMVNAIDVSPHDPGTAYIAVAGYKLDDFRPYIYKLTDYGRRSKRLDRNLPKNNFIRVVREDPERQGLLYAGGEGGMYVSFDGGSHWQSLALKLPPVPITDLAIRQDDLVASTQGRGFWVLDDLTGLRSVSPDMAEKPLHVFTPGPVEMIRRGRGGRGAVFTAQHAGGFLADGLVALAAQHVDDRLRADDLRGGCHQWHVTEVLAHRGNFP